VGKAAAHLIDTEGVREGKAVRKGADDLFIGGAVICRKQKGGRVEWGGGGVGRGRATWRGSDTRFDWQPRPMRGGNVRSSCMGARRGCQVGLTGSEENLADAWA
jgi:hypothetical protein